MTAQSIASPQPAPVSLVHTLIRKWRERQREVQTCRALMKFDDHMLEDIGLTRGDVACAIVRRAPLSRA